MSGAKRMKLDVEAFVNKKGHINLEVMGMLQPQAERPTACSTPPVPADILAAVRYGDLSVHPDRKEITAKDIAVQMGTIRRNARNKGNLGVEDAWNASCQHQLCLWLASKKDGRARAQSPLPALCDKSTATWLISSELPFNNTLPFFLVQKSQQMARIMVSKSPLKLVHKYSLFLIIYF